MSQRWGQESKTEKAVVHELLSTVNVHKTGHLHGLLPIHEGMRMRLLCKLSAVDGLVNERPCTVVKIVPHKDEAEIPQHYHEVKLQYSLRLGRCPSSAPPLVEKDL